jgi:hypothetical protein
MKIFKLFEKKLSKSINKGLVAYTNNTRILKNKRKQFAKKILPEFKELVYDFLLYWESPRSFWTIKFFIVSILIYISVNNAWPILKGFHQKMLVGHEIILNMENYQTDNLFPFRVDKSNADKILISYWTNYL